MSEGDLRDAEGDDSSVYPVVKDRKLEMCKGVKNVRASHP